MCSSGKCTPNFSNVLPNMRPISHAFHQVMLLWLIILQMRLAFRSPVQLGWCWARLLIKHKCTTQFRSVVFSK
jgi:hypothetical protein